MAILLVLSLAFVLLLNNGGSTVPSVPAPDRSSGPTSPAEATPSEATAAVRKEPPARNDGPVRKVAVMAPVTKWDEQYGDAVVRGVRLAARELNADPEGAYRMKVVVVDSKWRPKSSRRAARRIARRGDIVAVVGPMFSVDTAVGGGFLNDAGIPFVTPAAPDPKAAQQGWENFFRLVGTYDRQYEVVARVARRRGRSNRVALVDLPQEWSRHIGDLATPVLETSGIDIVGRYGLAGDIHAVARRIASSRADAVVFTGDQRTAGTLTRALARTRGRRLPVVALESAFGTELFPSQVPTDELWAVMIGSAHGELPRLDAHYLRKFGEQPALFAPQGYRAGALVARALRDGNGSRRRIREYLDRFDGRIAGIRVRFDNHGDMIRPPFYAYRFGNEGWSLARVMR